MSAQCRVDLVLDVAGPPRAIPTRRIDESNRKLIEVIQGACEGLARSESYSHFRFRVLGIKHPFFEREALVTRCDAGKIAGRRVTGRTPARAVEVLLAGSGISRLQVGDIDALASTFLRERVLLLGMDKGHQAGDLVIGQGKVRHALVGASVADNSADLVSVHIFGDEL